MLTSEQAKAAFAKGSASVNAGAGTGKTHLLAKRYVHHLREGLSPLQVVAVTYTERAAAELRSRIRQELRSSELSNQEFLLTELDAAQISTIHALALRICKDHSDLAGVKADFEVRDKVEGTLEQAEAINQALAQLPNETFAEIPYSQLKAILAELLEKPILARQALSCEVNRWEDALETVQKEGLARLLKSRKWQEASELVVTAKGRGGDKLEGLRQEAASYIVSLKTNDLAKVSTLAKLRIGNSGKKDNWPGADVAEVRAALISVRDLAKEAIKRDLLELASGPIDSVWQTRFAVVQEAFMSVTDHLNLAKERTRQLEFADLEIHAVAALDHAKVREHYDARWKAFLIDELQDTSPQQAAIIKALTHNAILTTVGDVKQSIFGFRGADTAVVQDISQLIRDKGGAPLELTKSFRAHQELLGAINACFSQVFDTYKPLSSKRSAAQTGPHLEAFVITTKEGDTPQKPARQLKEAYEIAKRIQRLLDDKTPVFDKALQNWRPIQLGDIAVLTRRWQPLDAFNEILPSLGVPTVHAGGSNLLETREAKDNVALLSSLAEPDDIALAAVLRSPYFAVSDRALYHLCLGKGDASLWSLLEATDEPELQHAKTTLMVLKALSQSVNASRLLQLADNKTGYSAVVANLPGHERRMADYRASLALVRQLEGGLGDIFSVSRRLKHLVRAEVKVDRPKLHATSSVSLMTIHSAKGLEWPVIFIADLDHDRSNRSSAFLDSQLGVAFKVEDASGKLQEPGIYQVLKRKQKHLDAEEARRLLYVAMTRASERLFLSATQAKGATFTFLASALQAAGVTFEEIVYSAPSATQTSTLSRSAPETFECLTDSLEAARL